MLDNLKEVLPKFVLGVAGGQVSRILAGARVPAQVMRLQFTEPDHSIHFDAMEGMTAREVFAGEAQLVYGSEVGACSGNLLSEQPDYLEDEMSFGEARQFFGINGGSVLIEGAADGYVRFGFGSNDEGFGSWIPEVGIGWGHSALQGSLRWIQHDDCIDGCQCYGNGEQDYETSSANLWVR